MWVQCSFIAGFEAKRKAVPYINDAMRASAEFGAYLDGKGSLPAGARFPVVAGMLLLHILKPH